MIKRKTFILVSSNIRNCENWTLSDALEKSDKNISTKTSPMRLPMNSFNHIAREVLSLEKSLNFYVDVLGKMSNTNN